VLLVLEFQHQFCNSGEVSTASLLRFIFDLHVAVGEEHQQRRRSLACWIYVIMHRKDYSGVFKVSVPTEVNEKDIEYIFSRLFDIAFDYKHPAISVSHTHPYIPDDFVLKTGGTTTLHEAKNVRRYSGISVIDKRYGDKTLLPDLVITFRGRKYAKDGTDEKDQDKYVYLQKVKKFEVVYPGAYVVATGLNGKEAYSATLVATSVQQFEKKCGKDIICKFA